MDDLLREFLTESAEHLDTVDAELVRFERDPTDQAVLRNVFRLVHTIKGTCGFLGLPRLEALAHAAETLMGCFRDGAPVSPAAVTLVLATLDRLKTILNALGSAGAEPAGDDADLIGALESLANAQGGTSEAEAVAAFWSASAEGPPTLPASEPAASPDPLEAAFLTAPGPDAPQPAARVEEAAPVAPPRTDADLPRAADKGGVVAQGQTIRVGVETVEHLMTMVSELVLTRNQLLEIARATGSDAYTGPLQRLSQVTAELQEGVMRTRMQPVGNAWQKLPRVVRDLSAELGKPIELIMVGAETELDRQVLDVIKDPLTHMVRNSADHGIEATNERIKAGKPARGTIRLSAYHEGGTVTVEIADDGKGMDLAAIRRKAVERGLASQAEAERMTDAQAAKFILHAGFSTAKAVTSVSGRGIGMDVVKTNIETIGGIIDIATRLGHGTTFTIKIPLTLAIVAALIVQAGDSRFALPQVAVLELVRVGADEASRIERINGTPVLRLRDSLLPVVPLSGVLGMDDAPSVDGFVVVAQVGRQCFGILVDEVFHTEEIVVKPMSAKLGHLSLFAGNTILGDGAVVLIVDPNGIAERVAAGSRQDLAAAMADAPSAALDDAASYLVFRAGGDLRAVPLSLVTRLETVDADRIEWLGGRPVIQYRGRLMPLAVADAGMSVRREGSQDLLVFTPGERPTGLLVDAIVDIVSERVEIEPASGRPGILGTAVLRGRATDLVDLAHFLPSTGGGAAGAPSTSAAAHSDDIGLAA
ncbi:chemotaxis protein CheW [Methylobacterium fujisawaense]|uniref:chemotaxis protein CheW n=1 Tax=Methylobacterium fujisawaense TaxID=107400 RepID=UPI0036FA0E10